MSEKVRLTSVGDGDHRLGKSEESFDPTASPSTQAKYKLDRKGCYLGLPTHEQIERIENRDAQFYVKELRDELAVTAWNWHRNLRYFRLIRCGAVVAGSSVSVVAATSAPRLTLAVLGAVVVIIEGICHVGRFQELAMAQMRLHSGAIRELFLFIAKAGIYGNSEKSYQCLVERIEMIKSENSKGLITVIKASTKAS